MGIFSGIVLLILWLIDLASAAGIVLLGYVFPIRATWRFVTLHLGPNASDAGFQEGFDDLLVLWTAVIIFEGLFIPVDSNIIKFLEFIEYDYQERNIALFRVMVLSALHFNLFEFRYHFLNAIKSGMRLASGLLRRVKRECQNRLPNRELEELRNA